VATTRGRKAPRAGATSRTDRLIVVGSSAGGIEALSVMVAGLPTTLPAAIVVAQHLHPEHPSSLVEIIQRHTELQVVGIEDRTPLRNGSVYIVPPNRHVSVTDHDIRLDADDAGRPKPSIDRLLETAAEVFGERLIAVILSGTGSDGAAGARYVAAAGGTVIAQDPETAAFPAMPQSLLPQTVDAVTRVEAIGPLLESLLSGATNLKDSDDGLERFLLQLRERTGIDFAAYRRPTIVRRLERRLAATRSSGLAEYRRYILRHPDEVHRLRSSLLIKVTDFFRDPDLFTEIRATYLPRLIDQARERRELRLWSAGCATGEEAYSLAILVAEALGNDLGRWNVRIFATDADPEAIAFARRGVYPTPAVEGVDPALLARHFRHLDGEYEVGPHIRAMTVFGEHDLGQRAPFPRIDLVLCRNVLIYFTPELQRRALQLFAFSLRDGGYLALGKSETTNPQPSAFVIENATIRIFRRSGDRVLIPATRLGDVPLLAYPRPLSGRRSTSSIAPTPIDREREPARPSERAETILNRLPVGVCVVDATYDTSFLNTAARSLLGIHGAAIGQDFIHQARALDSDALRGAIDQALAGEAATNQFAVTTETPIGTPRTLELRFAPMTPGGAAARRTILVTVIDVSTIESARLVHDTERAQATAELDRLATQAQRLTETNRDLLRGNEELAQTNGELRAANDELQVYNEELQAASEEVETLNEELQATNEELETLNEELQATVEELNTANDDLAARSARGNGSAHEMPDGTPILAILPDPSKEGPPLDEPPDGG
jgi:two-component system CheB/CheR fusion protein